MGRLDLRDPDRDEDQTARLSLWFITPAHERVELARICFAQHAAAHRALAADGIDATSIVIAEDANLDSARRAGLRTLERPNRPLGRKFNDGYELAAREGADYVIPLGSDDWIDPALIKASITKRSQITSHSLFSCVRADGRRSATLRINYDGGNGIRIIPTKLLEPLGYRPAADTRHRGIDGSTEHRLKPHFRDRALFRYVDLHEWQTVGFQSTSQQLTRYAELVRDHAVEEHDDPFRRLAEHYPLTLVDRMRAHYGVAA